MISIVSVSSFSFSALSSLLSLGCSGWAIAGDIGVLLSRVLGSEFSCMLKRGKGSTLSYFPRVMSAYLVFVSQIYKRLLAIEKSMYPVFGIQNVIGFEFTRTWCRFLTWLLHTYNRGHMNSISTLASFSIQLKLCHQSPAVQRFINWKGLTRNQAITMLNAILQLFHYQDENNHEQTRILYVTLFTRMLAPIGKDKKIHKAAIARWQEIYWRCEHPVSWLEYSDVP